MIDEDIRSFIKSTVPYPLLSCEPLTGGANNRVYKLNFSDRNSLILKRYFQHPQDLRKRLFSEYSFLQYAWNIGLRCIPQPLYSDEKANAAIYSFIIGKPVEKMHISDLLIQQTINFFLALNNSNDQGKTLPIASEACFSIDEHLRTIEKRVKTLLSCEHPTVIEFLQHQLLPAWEKIRKTIEQTADCPLFEQEQCISPSDFGFHNALLQENNQLAFIDFEYAGWDDPAKTVCDFFCQPRIPVSRSFFHTTSHQFVSFCSHPENVLQRINLLFPAYRIKWCCIILNCFLPIGQTRRCFARLDEQNEEQLKKAKEMLAEDFSWRT